MSKDRLTTTQENLKKEIDEIIRLFGLNYSDIEDEDREARTARLKLIKDQYIRSEVIMAYVLIDEFLNDTISWYLFGRRRSLAHLWKTQKFRNFNYYVLEKLNLLNKLDLAKVILKMPRAIESAIKRINDLKNGLAHSFFPENLRRNKPIYRNENIYSIKGLKLFEEDRKLINNYFGKKLFGASL